MTRNVLASFVRDMPYPANRIMAYIPFSIRFGPEYSRQRKIIREIGSLKSDSAAQRAWRAGKLREIIFWAVQHHPFYRRLLGSIPLDGLNDRFALCLKSLPVVTKADLQATPLEQRTLLRKGCRLSNTGGSTGQTMAFYVDRHFAAREWAHMRWIWRKLNYEAKDLRLIFNGEARGETPLQFKPHHNAYAVNLCCAPDLVAHTIRKTVVDKQKIRFLHGYPSAIYEFISYCQTNERWLVNELRKSLKGLLFGSEYPLPVHREALRECLGVNSISWYGHSEGSILAYETSPYVYAPMQTYGFAEAVSAEGSCRLVCTGYYNRVHPFIRYDTGDLIEPLDVDESDGALTAFRIKEGRNGEYVTDAVGNRISLTALIFGRHHPLFEKVRFLQVAQQTDGIVLLIATRSDVAPDLCAEKALAMVNADGVNIVFKIVFVDRPIRAKSGKALLKVPWEEAPH
jgi:phenylacetate-CoA ligase